MENKKVALVVLLAAMAVLTDLTLAADDKAGHSDGGADRSDGGNEVLIDAPGGASVYKNLPLSRFFLREKYLPDGGLGCIPNGGFCMFEPLSCCVNCGCILVPGVCYCG